MVTRNMAMAVAVAVSPIMVTRTAMISTFPVASQPIKVEMCPNRDWKTFRRPPIRIQAYKNDRILLTVSTRHRPVLESRWNKAGRLGSAGHNRCLRATEDCAPDRFPELIFMIFE